MSSSGARSRQSHWRTAPAPCARSDLRKPHLLEVIAIFSEASRARSYAAMENQSTDEPITSAAPNKTTVMPPDVATQLSQRQSAVLGALRQRMDNNQQVAEKPPIWRRHHRYPLAPFTRFSNRSRRNSSLKPCAPVPHEPPRSIRFCDHGALSFFLAR